MAGGRPCKLTPEVAKAICDALRAGATQRMAADFAGVGERTMHAWLASKAPAFQQFQQDVKGATAKGDVGALAIIQQAAKSGTWQAAAWLLERRHPSEYGRRQVVALQRVHEPDARDLEAAAQHGVSARDAAVLFQRQLSVLEAAYTAGQIDALTYLGRMDRLNAQATRLAELSTRTADSSKGAPHVALSLTLDSTAIDNPAPLPAGVVASPRAPAGGDLIDVG